MEHEMTADHDEHIHCRCGYNRQGLDENALCPECGSLELRPKDYPRTPVARAMWIARKLSTWDFFPRTPDQSQDSASATVAVRMTATISFWTCIMVLLQYWFDEAVPGELPEHFILPVVAFVLIAMLCSFVAVLIAFASLFNDKKLRVLRNLILSVVAGILPPFLLYITILARV